MNGTRPSAPGATPEACTRGCSSAQAACTGGEAGRRPWTEVGKALLNATFLPVAFLTSALLALVAPTPAWAEDVVVFGDSWAEFSGDELAETFIRNGHPEITVDNQGIGGTTAGYWAAAPWALPYAVSLNSDAQWVWLSIGGNDVFGYYSSGQGAIAAESIDRDIRIMLDELFAYYPRMQVVMFAYDFVNFEQSVECIAMASVYMPGMNTQAINETFLHDIGEVQKAIAADYPNVSFVDVWGTLQKAGGVPNAPNVQFPSPAAYMADCIHANDDGYRILHQALYDAYWAPQLEGSGGCSSMGAVGGTAGGLSLGILLGGLVLLRRRRGV